MKIIYRVYGEWDFGQLGVLASYGIKPEPGFSSFEIEEGPRYSKLKDQLQKWKVNISYGTLFDEDEINNSTLLVYKGSWTNGYPQPENGFGYIGTTYDDKHYCKTCGIGAVQQSPFRLKKEPNWGNKQMFSLNWVFDEVFVRKDAYEQVFKKFNVATGQVLLYKKEKVIENTVQLLIPSVNVPLDLDTYPYEICDVCKRKKYDPQIKGFFPSFKQMLDRNLAIFKCEEYFGSGASAHHKIFITQLLRQELLKHKINVQFIPVLDAHQNGSYKLGT